MLVALWCVPPGLTTDRNWLASPGKLTCMSGEWLRQGGKPKTDLSQGGLCLKTSRGQEENHLSLSRSCFIEAVNGPLAKEVLLASWTQEAAKIVPLHRGQRRVIATFLSSDAKWNIFFLHFLPT